MDNTTNATETTTNETVVKPIELTSEKLVQLRGKRLAAKQAAKAAEIDSVDEKNALLDVFKLESEIAAELKALQAAETEKQNAAKRAEILAVNANQLVAHEALFLVMADKKSTVEQKNAANDSFNTAREAVENQLLSRISVSKPKPTGTDGKPTQTGSRSENREKIVALHIANLNSGMSESDSRKAIESDEFPKSTVWHAVNDWKKAQTA